MSTSSMKPRLEYARLAAELFQRYLSFNNAFRMDHDLALLVDIRASQLNGCAFCLDMHVKQARTHGERELQRGTTLVILLCGGDKGSQARDIEAAKRLARDGE